MKKIIKYIIFVTYSCSYHPNLNMNSNKDSKYISNSDLVLRIKNTEIKKYNNWQKNQISTKFLKTNVPIIKYYTDNKKHSSKDNFDSNNVSLTDYLIKSLEDNRWKITAILGDMGIGKTSLVRNFGRKVWNKINPNNTNDFDKYFLPIYINPIEITNEFEVKNDIISFLITTLESENYGFKSHEVERIVKNGVFKYIIIIDGYEDLLTKSNLYSHKFSQYLPKSKVIITCNKNIFDKSRDHIYSLYPINIDDRVNTDIDNTKYNDQGRTIYISPLDFEDSSKYIKDQQLLIIFNDFLIKNKLVGIINTPLSIKLTCNIISNNNNLKSNFL